MRPKAGLASSAVPLSHSTKSWFGSLYLPAFLLLAPFLFSCDRIHSYFHPDAGKIGFIDHQGKFVIKPQYQWIQGFTGSVAAVEMETRLKSADGSQYNLTRKLGAINTRGDWVVPLEYDSVRALGDGFIMAQKDKDWFLFDENGKNLCPEPFDQPFTDSGDGLVEYEIRRKDGNWEHGFLDKGGNRLYTTVYLNNPSTPARVYNNRFGEGLVWAVDKKGLMLVDREGRVTARFTSAGVTLNAEMPFVNGFSAVATSFSKDEQNFSQRSNWGYVNTKCEWVVPGMYAEAHDFSEGLGCVKMGKLYGFVDATGKEVIPPQFDDVGQDGFTNGRCVVSKGKKDVYFYVDFKGKRAIDADFEGAYGFHEELAAVRVKGKWGFIDKSGKFVIKPRFSSVGSFNSGLAAASE